jgi:succinoglycan biosynthesis protein ExoM
VQGGFFERPRFATGERLTYARTSNALVTAELLRRWTPPFDERFGLTGGEDTHFFMRARLAGATMVWCDDAVVEEAVPASRVALGWLLRREYRRGNTLSLCLRELRPGAAPVVRRVVAAFGRIGHGLGLTATGAWRGRVAMIRGLQRVAYGLGQLTGLSGRAYEEYRTTHGA